MKKFAIILMSSMLMNLYCHSAFAKNPHHHAMNNHPTHSLKSKKSPTIQLSIQKIIDKKDKKLVLIQLTDTTNNKPITLNDLIEAHTKKIHLLIIDESLMDYSHVHPVETGTPGIYQFEWQPTLKNASYRAWADLLPANTKTQEYVIANFPSPNATKKMKNHINQEPLFESTVDGYTFKLSFDKTPLQVGQAVMGKIDIVDAKGNPVHTLEPIMGAYAHIVGFNEDFKTVIHVHPMGKEPTSETERGGPELQFHVESDKAGFIKLFAQVQINGKTHFAPFRILVRKA
ncbi:TPA: hypothetical protein ACW6D3_002649 [Legionella pneumophila]|uniref:hypothetical protein n=1 Tax=Legionella pneumophila TaxID=446 RepID=UPI0005C9A833|nr:hypothetical protein [Legionella pneumophila]HCC3243552.1 hypothetical protein [Legionella pneumophila subsp. pneumophila]MCZ4683343.1 hypothetical protein [Legionella pneumophila]HDV5789976.1 hypothetical protein [Legionella pneumophila]HDV5798959.1 hypothetical protein [Legionella pneumophila]HDV5948524.1 hypothetical protein [Legionella pneumophila]